MIPSGRDPSPGVDMSLLVCPGVKEDQEVEMEEEIINQG
jgi:hypothetical protein